MEQKNWTHVRQLLGYERLEDSALVEAINDLYRECREPLHNYFLPSAKLEEKCREGAKLKHKHDKPQTPYERQLEFPDVRCDNEGKVKEREWRSGPIPVSQARELGVDKTPWIKEVLPCSTL